MVAVKNELRGAHATDVRAHVLRSATRLFAARGFEGTTLQAIADEVGVTKPSVLHHFPSKEALRTSVLDNMLAHWSDALPRLLLAATAGAGRFDALVGEMISFFAADTDRAKLLVREALDRPEAVRSLLTAQVRPWQTAIAEYIQKGQKHDEHFADVDSEAYVLHVISLVIAGLAVMDTFCALLPTTNPRASRERYLAEIVRIAKSSLFEKESAEAVRPRVPASPKNKNGTTR
jgi:TetR/AcrR family transcriptional regulator